MENMEKISPGFLKANSLMGGVTEKIMTIGKRDFNVPAGIPVKNSCAGVFKYGLNFSK
jgi:hypothetical protein